MRTFVVDLALVFCVATVATIAFQRLRQPAVLGYLLAGLIVGPYTAVPLFADHHRIEALAELGIILVIFVIGLEFSVGKLARALPVSGLSGAVQITAMLWLGYMLGRVVGWSSSDSLFLGGAVSISSTMIVARVLGERDEDPRLLDNVFGILIVQDLAAIVLIAVFTAIANGAGMPATEVALVVGKLVLFLVGCIAAGLLVVPRLIREAHHRASREVVLVAAIGTCFGMALLAEHLGYSVALGAFIAGSLVAESGLRHEVEELVQPIRDMFAAVFFVSIGMLVDPRAMAHEWPMILGVTALVVLGQIVFTSVGSVLAGRSVRIAVRSGMSLAQIGEFSFILVGIGVAAGVARSSLLAIAVGAAVLTTFFTPYLITLSDPVALKVEARLPHRVQTFVALYATWFESLRRPREGRRSVRRHAVFLVLDLLIVTAVIVGFAVFRQPLAGELANRLGVGLDVGGGLALVAALVLAGPFAIGLARNVHRLGVGLASVALPAEAPGRVDLADAPRRALVVGLQLGFALAVYLPLIALTQPFLPLYVGLILLAALLVVLGVSLWRRATNLEDHYRAGAELVLEVLDRQRHRDHDDHDHGADELNHMLPGLGPLITIELAADSPAASRTLAEINLRAKTGATVVAIQRATGEGIGTPSGGEVLAAGDLLTITGTSAAVERARRLLAEPEQPSSPGDPEDGR